MLKVKSDIDFQAFKKKIIEFLQIDEEIYVTAEYNNNIHDSEQYAFDKKNNLWLTLKQLRISDGYLIHVKPLSSYTKSGNTIVNIEEERTILVRLDEEDPEVFRMMLSSTYADVYQKVAEKYSLTGNSFRLRKEYDKVLLHQDRLDVLLSNDEVFVEDSCRLQIEFGEAYKSNEVLLHVTIDINNNKTEKEFIGNPKEDKIKDIKGLFCKNLGVKDEDFKLYKVNAMGDPTKPFKDENKTLSQMSLKDNETIYLKNINEDPYEFYVLRIFMEFEDVVPSVTLGGEVAEEGKIKASNNLDNKELSYYYRPIPESNKILELTVSKNTLLGELKQQIVQELKLKIKDDNTSCLRIRGITKNFDAERILRGSQTPIKKLNIDNPANLLIENLNEPEELLDNQLEIHFLLKNKTTNSYDKKDATIWTFNDLATSDQIYEFCKQKYATRDILLAKYAKAHYRWEVIEEMDSEGVINLRKSPYSLRDGGKSNYNTLDWIGVVEIGIHDSIKEIKFQSADDLRV